MSFGEYRAKHGLPTQIEENDFLLNSTWIQYKQMQAGMQQQQSMMGGVEMGGNSENNDDNTRSIFSEFTMENPFIRDLENFAVEKGWKN